ncbi:glycosyltransferase family 2 protein, partial [Streptomyces albidoflavus]
HRVVPVGERFAYFRSRTWAEGLSKALVARSVGTGDGLASERRHATRALPAAVARGLADALRGRRGGAARAGAVLVGTASAAGGYLAGSWRARRADAPAFTVPRVPGISPATDAPGPTPRARS